MASFDGQSFSLEPEESGRVITKLNELIEHAENLVKQCDELKHIKGIAKFKKRCLAELNFVQQLKKKPAHLIESHLNSTNIGHLEGIVEAATTLPHVIEIMHKASRPYTLVVDLICGQGRMWVKVIARNAQALHLIWAGNGQFGDRNVMEQAEHYIACARQNPHQFKIPSIQFRFHNGVTYPLAAAMERLGIEVIGERCEVSEDVQNKLDFSHLDSSDEEDDDDDDDEDDDSLFSSGADTCRYTDANSSTTCGISSDKHTCHPGSQPNYTEQLNMESKHITSKDVETCSHLKNSTHVSLKSEFKRHCDSTQESNTSETPIDTENHYTAGGHLGQQNEDHSLSVENIKKVNLDISTLLCLVSNVCHGKCDLVFKDEILSLMAEQERATPLLPELHQFMEGKELFACQTAVTDFNSILKTVGGPQENERARRLLDTITVVPDNVSARASELRVQGKVKTRTKIVFGTGDDMEAVTMTGNHGFVRAANGQGVLFTVYLHQSRALTEQKESTAVPFVSEHKP